MSFKKLPFNFLEVFISVLEPSEVNEEIYNLLTKKYIGNNLAFGCIPNCYRCCIDIILMSGYEYKIILNYIIKHWNNTNMDSFIKFIKKIGMLREDNSPICPFLDELNQKHCTIYPVRPWICRAFGTTAAPCASIPKHIQLPIPYEVHNNTSQKLANYRIRFNEHETLYATSFEVWCITESSESNAAKVLNLIKTNQYRLRAFIHDHRINKIVEYFNGIATTYAG